MVIIGLTGSIAMGKSTAARMFRRMGLLVHDSDATVHRLQARGGGAVPLIELEFPGSTINGVVDREVLARRVFSNPAALKRLERILHPLVFRASEAFMKQAALQRRRVVVVDVPLLFETGGEIGVDLVAVISAPPFVQRQRALRRAGMTPERLEKLLVLQMSDTEKRRRADIVVPSGLGEAATWRALRKVIREALKRPPRHWPPDRQRRRLYRLRKSNARNRPGH